MLLHKVAILIISIFWPLNLFLNNTPGDYLQYISPVILVIVAYKFFKSKNTLYHVPLILIPFVEPKLTIFPLLFFMLVLLFKLGGKSSKTKYFSNTKHNVVFLALSILIIFINWKSFYGQTIFVPDYEARQKVIRDTRLYPNTFTARLFHNKARIVIDKFNDNFFAAIDPNNYFFGFHPRQIVGNQNLQKFPFLAIIPFLFGVYFFHKLKNYRFILIFGISSLLALSMLSIYDRQDFLLWPVITLITVSGIYQIGKNKPKLLKYYLFIFFLFSIPELLRVFIN